MRERGGSNQNPERAADLERLIDSALDGETGASDQDRIRKGLRSDPKLARDVASTQRMISMLRLSDPTLTAPDLSGDILRRVHRHRRFVPANWRRAIGAGRIAVAASLVLGLGLVAAAHRHGTLKLAPAEPTPLTNVVLSGQSVADRVADRLDSALNEPLAGTITSQARGFVDLSVREGVRGGADRSAGPTRVIVRSGDVQHEVLLGRQQLGRPMQRPLRAHTMQEQPFAPLGISPTVRAHVLGVSVDQGSWTMPAPSTNRAARASFGMFFACPDCPETAGTQVP